MLIWFLIARITGLLIKTWVLLRYNTLPSLRLPIRIRLLIDNWLLIYTRSVSYTHLTLPTNSRV